MTKLQSQKAHTALTQEALTLLAQPLHHAQTQARIERWAAQSPNHARAMEVAKAQWALFAQVEDAPLGSIDRLKLAADLTAVKLSETPALAAGTILAIVIAAALPFVLVMQQETAELARVESNVVHSAPNTAIDTTYTSHRGEQPPITLEDGSTVWLNWDSEIVVRFAQAERHVDLLRGAAVFDVAKNADRPFIVHAGDAVAQVLGTQFAVHKHRADHITLEVKEGRVAVAAVDGDIALELNRAQAVTIAKNKLGDVRPIAISAVGSWRDGLLIFDERMLIDVLEELAHYTSEPLRLERIKAPERPVTATFFIDDIDDALKSLCELFDLQVDHTTDGALRVQSKA